MNEDVKKRLKETLFDKLGDTADNFFKAFESACDENGGIPPLSEIEGAVGVLDEDTRAAYSEFVHGTIESLDTEDLIASKKESLKGRG